MVTSQQIKQFTDYCEQHLDFTIADPPGYMSAPICALDSVFSIGICYRNVVRIVNRFCEFLREDSMNTVITTSEVIKRIEDISNTDLAEQYLSHHRTSTTNGILKTEAFRSFLLVMQSNGIEDINDIHIKAGNATFEKAIKNIPGQKSGLSLDYFYILSHMDNYVKDDRHIRWFVDQAIHGNSFKRVDRIELIRETAKTMNLNLHSGMTPRHLDHIIWNY